MSYPSTPFYLFANDFNLLAMGINGWGVLDGLAVSEKAAGADMSVDVASGNALVTKGTVKVAITISKNVAIGAAEDKPRKDIVVLSTGGVASVIKGTKADANPIGKTGIETKSPAPPPIPENQVTLAEVWVPANATSIINAYITDRRTMVVNWNAV